jgi:hypothetical protein
MEPEIEIHALIDKSTITFRMLATPFEDIRDIDNVCLDSIISNKGYVNGGLNLAVEYMKSNGFDYACLFHDDLVFSPLEIHRHSISEWFQHPLLAKSSGLRFNHFETLTPTVDMRLSPHEWDRHSLEDEELWNFLAAEYAKHPTDGGDICPPGRPFWFRYEGPDKTRKWNRLGPTGQVFPIATWEALGRFDEHEGIFYDSEYPTECFLRKLPPVYAVMNFPFIHLHNQSVNPWADHANGVWSDTEGAFKKRYGGTREDIWWGDWGSRWEGEDYPK